MNIKEIFNVIKANKNLIKKVSVATVGVISTLVAVRTAMNTSSKIKEAKEIKEAEYEAEDLALSMEEHPEYDKAAYDEDRFGTDVRFTQSVIKAVVIPMLAVAISLTCAYKFPKMINSNIQINENVVEESVSNENMD